MDRKLKVFKALSDETRLKIVYFLLDGEKCACKIIPHINRAQSTVSLQMRKLENLGIVKSRREGKSVYYRITNNDVVKVLDCLEGYKKKVAR